MMFIYTAKLYVEEKTIDERDSDDIEELYLWMMAKAHNQTTHYNGFIINNKTHEVIRTFQSCSIE
ncbi:hypothetical protein [Legionella parisiensis]|uniref:Uncharacterized protein n=1 Tax=Legionella parisiensis TaxID=45071 RepID=A0A1E5JKT5_9GAMM|nr:hypothetical protein [Legionella parisiensis]KTD43076.1 hypothetical protein Lpar_1053 [Legionella parisiensis]OEH45155.1 hypothetical protein lpari_03925 [Legionella parisiensis]STX77845.1 Uncharacterised protein [Legionella parisiensis]